MTDKVWAEYSKPNATGTRRYFKVTEVRGRRTFSRKSEATAFFRRCIQNLFGISDLGSCGDRPMLM